MSHLLIILKTGKERPVYPDSNQSIISVPPKSSGDCVYFALDVRGILSVGECIYTGSHGAIVSRKDEGEEREDEKEEREKREGGNVKEYEKKRQIIVDSSAREACSIQRGQTFKTRKAGWMINEKNQLMRNVR